MSILRSGFSDLFFQTALPVLNNVVMEKYRSKPDALPMIFNIDTSDKWGEQSTSITGFGLVPQAGENADVEFDDVLQGYDKTYTHNLYKLAFRISKETIDDEKWGLIRKASQALGRSMFNTRQIQGASVFNNGFNAGFAGPDGVALFSTSHPLVGGGTASNTLSVAADLDVTSLRQAIQQFEETVDDRGLLLNIMPRYLLIPNELQWDAEELLKSMLRPDTAENAINAFQMKNLEYMIFHYLTDDDSWFILSELDEHSLRWWEREEVNTSSDYNWMADASLTKIRNRFSFGWDDWRGTLGVQGA